LIFSSLGHTITCFATRTPAVHARLSLSWSPIYAHGAGGT
jgi:hypothetical protein